MSDTRLSGDGTGAPLPAPLLAPQPPPANRVAVLMYHRVDRPQAARDRGFTVAPPLFAAHLEWLAAQRYRPCTMADFERWYLHGAALPERSVLITFDDGFAGLHRHALPLLAARQWPATVFLVSGMIGRRDDWRSREFGSAGSDDLLSREQIVEMARHGIEFGSHSRTHADLSAIAVEVQLRDQVQGSRDELQQLLGRPVTHFAYPYGRHDTRVRRAVRDAGYTLAFSVAPGFNRTGGDAWQVRRLDITGHDTRVRFARKVEMGSNDGSFTSQAGYLARRALARVGLGA